MRKALMVKLALYGAMALAVVLALGLGAYAYVALAVERPKYQILAADGVFELRDYPALRAAQVATDGPRGDAVRAGFRPLAAYIFARNRPGPSIAMTAPVTQTPENTGADGRAWTVRFIMPASFALDDLPAPSDARIRLVEIPRQRVAAVRFSGDWTDDRFAAFEGRLRDWIDAKGWTAASEATFAYYNDPLTPGFLRRNEVLIEIVR